MKRNSYLSNLLKLPWQEDPREARRIYMQIYRSSDPEKVIMDLLMKRKRSAWLTQNYAIIAGIAILYMDAMIATYILCLL